jgi:hypothetical protein
VEGRDGFGWIRTSAPRSHGDRDVMSFGLRLHVCRDNAFL